MARIDQLDQPTAVDMSVDLRGRNIGMAKHSLQGAQVRAPGKQMRGESVAKDMRADFGSIQARLGRELLDNLEQPYPADVAAT